jgi:hypothetical protein
MLNRGSTKPMNTFAMTSIIPGPLKCRCLERPPCIWDLAWRIRQNAPSLAILQASTFLQACSSRLSWGMSSKGSGRVRRGTNMLVDGSAQMCKTALRQVSRTWSSAHHIEKDDTLLMMFLCCVNLRSFMTPRPGFAILKTKITTARKLQRFNRTWRLLIGTNCPRQKGLQIQLLCPKRHKRPFPTRYLRRRPAKTGQPL